MAADPTRAPVSPGAGFDTDLLEEARAAMNAAYAPYSRFRVGAAVVDDSGRVHRGANVENASYGLTMCAERVAIFTAVAAGARRIHAVAVVAERQQPVTPCGACRQVMSEFCDADARVLSESTAGDAVAWTVCELLPHAFAAQVSSATPAQRLD